MDPVIVDLFAKRKRAPKKRIPYVIPLDRSPLEFDWASLLRKSRTRQEKQRRRRVSVKPIVPSNPSVIGTSGTRTTPQLRSLLAGVRLAGVSKELNGKLDRLTGKHRLFLHSAHTPLEIARWWHNLYCELPEPVFFILYTILRAVR